MEWALAAQGVILFHVKANTVPSTIMQIHLGETVDKIRQVGNFRVKSECSMSLILAKLKAQDILRRKPIKKK